MEQNVTLIADRDVQVVDGVAGLIAKGACGEVRRGTYKGEIVAVKSLFLLQGGLNSLPESDRQIVVKEFFRECELQSRFRQPNILPALGIVERGSEYLLVTPFMKDGTLTMLLYNETYQDKRRIRLSDKASTLYDHDQLRIVNDVFEALHYLAQNSVVHRDIKPDNILIKVNAATRDLVEVKLSDFGLGKVNHIDTIRGMTVGTWGKGTPNYWAPEVEDADAIKGPKVDVFSAGVVIIEMNSGRKPKPGNRTKKEGKGNTKKTIVVPENERRGADLKAMHDDFFRQVALICIKDEADQRTSADAVLRILQEAAKFHGLSNDTFKWVWGDVGCNCLRWSVTKNLQKTIDQLKRYSNEDPNRPVDVSIVRAGSVVKKLSFKTVVEAMIVLTRKAALQLELGSLSLRDLLKRAESAGVDSDEVDAADDKAALISLIVSKPTFGTQAAAEAAKKESDDAKFMQNEFFKKVVADMAGSSRFVLDLPNKGITDADAEAIAAALPSCPQITTLCLQDNQIGDAGAQAIAAALPSCPQFFLLRLDGNHVGDAGVQAFVAALPSCPEFDSFVLCSNPVGVTALESLRKAWKKAGKTCGFVPGKGLHL